MITDHPDKYLPGETKQYTLRKKGGREKVFGMKSTEEMILQKH
jgi:hypothetical protein